MEIRIAKEEDCKSLSILKREVWESTYRGIYPDEKIDKYNFDLNEDKFKNMIKKQSQKLFVLQDNSDIIGYMSFGEILRPFDNHMHDIGLLYISKEHQGCGLGRKLFEFAQNEFKNQGIDEFIVSCNKYNLPAQNFYKKMGGKIIRIDEDDKDRSIPQIKFQFSMK